MFKKIKNKHIILYYIIGVVVCQYIFIYIYIYIYVYIYMRVCVCVLFGLIKECNA